MKRPGRGALLWAGLSCALLLECSTIVMSVDNVRCTDEGRIGPPACDSGWFCGYGRCRTCDPKEACKDRLDNDCNGLTDDGCAGAGGSTSAESAGKMTQAAGG